MNVKRLELMVTMLEEVLAGTWKPVKKAIIKSRILTDEIEFDLESWLGTTRNCGYTACAVGHATLDLRFRKMGFSNDGWDPYYKGEDSWDAVERFFGIGVITAEYLFRKSNYPEKLTEKNTIRQVINRIKYLIHHGNMGKFESVSDPENYMVTPKLRVYKRKTT